MTVGVRAALGSVFLLAVLGPGAARGDDEARMQGTWRVTSGMVGNTTFKPGQLKAMRIIIEGRKVTFVESPTKTEVVHFKLVPGKKHKEIEFRQGPTDTRIHYHGIYALEGKRIRLCWAPGGEPRPNDFSTKNKDQHRLYTIEK